MKTVRLYYDDSYLTTFSATVVLSCGNRIALDRSAFYPTSGGQPYDTGTLSFPGGVCAVTDVNVEEDIVWHTVDAPIPLGTPVQGEICWERRFDHMQQHAGDHMIAGAIWQCFQGVTIGLHTGQAESTIDIAMPEGKTHLTDEETSRIEEMVNARIQKNDPIRCWFPPEDVLSALPLRKKPTVNRHVRVVAMGDYEMVACGGTHPSSTGQIGPVKILSTAPSRGNMRLTFLAGMRAMRHYQCAFNAVREMGARLSADIAGAPAALEKLLETSAQQQRESQARLTEAAIHFVRAHATEKDGFTAYACHLPFGDNTAMQQAAKTLIQSPRTLVLLSCPGGKGRTLLFARSADVQADVAALLRSCSGKGGGKPDFAQGSTTDEALPLAALSLL